MIGCYRHPDTIVASAMPFNETLFDRFDPGTKQGVKTLARDIADILGARRAFAQRMGGVLNWGLPDIAGLAPSVEQHRQYVADEIAHVLTQFEPRLDSLSVTPIPDSKDFAFRLEAHLIDAEDETLTLRILSPRRGGGLGADVVVVGSRINSDESDKQ